MKTGSRLCMAETTSSFPPRTVRVRRLPRCSQSTMSRSVRASFVMPGFRTHWTLWMLSFMSSKSREKRMPPLCRRPTWSQMSSSSLKL